MSAHVTPRSWSLRRAFVQALVLSLIPLGTASAQQYGYGFVQVTRESTDIDCFGPTQEVCMTAPKGTVLEVLYIEGDRYEHRNSNWYWVLLPPDHPYGTRLTGWIRGNVVEHFTPPPATRTAQANVDAAPQAADARTEPRDEVMSAPMGTAPARPVITDVVVNFEFNKSALTDEARHKLDSAVVGPTANAVAVALEGHADWIGRENYNERLGQARAESVKRYMTEKLGIPADRISVVSYGESDPVAPNTTSAGRAQNRRVVIRGGGSPAGTQ
jgi:outer membrane protein OmpA-like peptidoglycan-associated protein